MSGLDRLVERALDWALEVGLYGLVAVALGLGVAVVVAQIVMAVNS